MGSEQAQVAGQGACCCWQQPEMLQQLLLVALLVAPLGGAPAAPAPSPGVEEEGGRLTEANLRLPGSIVAPLSRAELFQRPRPRIGSSSLPPFQALVADFS